MLYFLAFLGGVAGLTWELLWMHYTALSLGVSAQGAALTLVAFSLGTAGGSLLAGRVLKGRALNPLVAWGLLELALGVLGQGLASGFSVLTDLDSTLFTDSPGLAPLVHGLGVLGLVALPSACMGATIPVFAELAKARKLSIARLYASNVGGAALGVALATFVLIPAAGVAATVDFASSVDLLLGLALYAGARRAGAHLPAGTAQDVSAQHRLIPETSGELQLSPKVALLMVAVTGFATFALEVAWFRSFRAAFQATTEGFALVLFAVLISLSAGAAVAPRLRRSGRVSLGVVAGAAALAVLVSTPLVERMDQVVLLFVQDPRYFVVVLGRLGLALVVLGPSMFLIGIILPWCMESFSSSADTARLYAANTASAVAGSLLSAWVLLPSIGFAKTAWLAAAALAFAAAVVAPKARLRLAIAVGLGGLVAGIGASDVGELRVQINGELEHKVLATHEGPDATVSVIEQNDGVRFLVIDGFHATGTGAGEHYMAWMGHLPMLMHPDPKQALVICFGTGQTANAVRREGPEHLDIVDVSGSVFAMADWFDANEGVLDDPKVSHHVMDGRAWLRRTQVTYDVITLEPMPPTFAGSNALYSLEFYERMASRLSPDGVVAQWLPFHLVDPEESASVTATFLAVFPDAYLWIDSSGTGILLGRAPGNEGKPLWARMGRQVKRALTPQQVVSQMYAGPRELAAYAEIGEIITDDNQSLSYGWGRERWWRQGRSIADTIGYQHKLIEAMGKPGLAGIKLAEFLASHPHPAASAESK